LEFFAINVSIRDRCRRIRMKKQMAGKNIANYLEQSRKKLRKLAMRYLFVIIKDRAK
jgi:hypothetical protein